MSQLVGSATPTATQPERTKTVTDDATHREQLKAIRSKIAEAQGEGDSREANRLHVEEQRLIAEHQGNRPIVGGGGRTA